MIYCDTSTLAKYYVIEIESAAVRAQIDRADEITISELARAELMGVFHRCLRERKWTQNQFRTVVRQFDEDDLRGLWSWAPLDSAILQQTQKVYSALPETIFLRASDCVHLVTALHHGFAQIHTHDAHQIKAASALGLKTVTIA